MQELRDGDRAEEVEPGVGLAGVGPGAPGGVDDRAEPLDQAQEILAALEMLFRREPDAEQQILERRRARDVERRAPLDAQLPRVREEAADERRLRGERLEDELLGR